MKICDSCGACFDDGYDLCGFDGGSLTPAFPGARVIGGRYLLEQRVAAGAMGVVLRATHLQVGSTVAVKLMRPEKDDTHVALARFQREAQILGQIKHPNAVLVIDFGVEQRGGDGQPYLVMEYLRGESLSSVLEKKGRLTLDELERILVPLCEAVEEAHAVGVIHRDIKPGNVVLEKLRDGSEIVKVLDFGIAKFVARGKRPERIAPAPVELGARSEDHDRDVGASEPAEMDDELDDDLDDLAELLADDDDDDFLDEVVATRAAAQSATVQERRPPSSDPNGGAPAGLRNALVEAHVDAHVDDRPPRDPTTEAGFMIGTIPYMAPEQMTGERISVRTDVHAVAVLAFQCLAGRLPYDGDDEDIIASKLSDERPSLADVVVDVPAEVDALLQRAFARDPAERPGTVRELGEGFRAAVLASRTALGEGRGDPVTAALVQLGAVERALGSVESSARAWVESAVPGGRGGEDYYAKARDVLLAVDAPLHRVRASLLAADAPLAGDVKARLGQAKSSFEAQVKAVRRSLARIEPKDGVAVEYGDYLAALWTRLDVVAQEILDGLTALADEDKASDTGPFIPVQLFAPVESPRTSSIVELADRLLARDPLDAVDALEELLEGAVDQVVRALGAGRDDAHADVAARLVRGLWRHADTVLLHELSPSRRAFRLLPFLAGLRDLPAAAPFLLLGKVLGAKHLDEADVELALASFERPEDRAVLARCLLVHPSDDVRTRAIGSLDLSELWNVIAHPSTPIPVEDFVFRHIRDRAPNEYLKIFFFCVREHLRAAASAADVADALRLLGRFFSVACFHEDIVFEPLLELDRTLRQRASATSDGGHDAGYAEALAAFTAGGVHESKPLEQMRDVPLPIQRKLAREGRFLTYFVSHSNDRVARETLPHLFRLEDVTPFLRIATIHRIVLTEISKRKRFFRKEPPKIALLQNPKTPAIVARMFLPLVSEEQLRILSTNKHINPDVRRLINAALARPRN